jgi:Ca2+-binding RTX toxin-like protein
MARLIAAPTEAEVYLDLAAGRVVPVKGTTRDDVLNGTDGADTIQGLGGDDVLSGMGGNDTLLGGGGTDRVDGGDGDDTIVETDPDGDILSGGAGNDTITVSKGYHDTPDTVLTLSGGDGDDIVKLNADRETLIVDLGEGDDRLDIQANTDGSSGVRTITLGAGRDTVLLNANSYLFSSIGAFHVTDFQAGRGGDYFDLGDYARSNGVNVPSEGYNPFAAGLAELIASGKDTLVVVQGLVVAVLENVRAKALVDENFGFDLDAPAPPGETFTGTEKSEIHYGTDLSDTITMLGGNDTVGGRYGNDLIDGGVGNDRLDGDQGADTLIGGDGNDTLDGGLGLDHVSGGAGDDAIVFSGDGDVIDGGAGYDTLVFYNTDGRPLVDLDARLLPRDGTILLNGQKGTGLEMIEQRLGQLGEGDDRFLLGQLWSAGLELYGGAGDDQIMSGNGNSQLTGDAGNDVLTSFNGDDQLAGDDGDDQLSGGSGRDLIDGGAGDDVLDGGKGDDELYAGGGINRLNGGAGNDFLFSNGLQAGTVLDGGTGQDRLTMTESASAVSLRLTAKGDASQVGDGLATVKNIEAADIQFSKFDDVLTVEAGLKVNVVANGLAGDDRLVAGAGTDKLIGGDGNDVLDGGTNVDTMTGGSGDDTYYVDNAQDLVIEADRGGFDQVFAAVSVTLATYVENGTLLGSAALSLTGNTLDNVLVGNAGANVLEGGYGSDRIDGGAGDDVASYVQATSGVTIDLSGRGAKTVADGNGGTDTLVSIEGLIGSNYADVLRGGDGANSLAGGNGDDVLDGGAGSDRLSGDAGADTVTYARSAVGVQVDLAAGRAMSGSDVDQLSSIETVIGSRFADTIVAGSTAAVLHGGVGNDTITGSAANDVINGGYGSDRIDGGAGVDTLSYADFTEGVSVDLTRGWADYYGQIDQITGIENLVGTARNDTLYGGDAGGSIDGGAGNDVVRGGFGNDTLIGGEGFDTISFERATAGVTIGMAGGVGSARGGTGSDSFSRFEAVVGSQFDDTIRVTDAGAAVDGGGGNDVIALGRDGAVLRGGDGIDTLDLGNLIGGIRIDLSQAGPQNTGYTGTMTITGFEAVAGGDYADTLIGGAADDTLGGGLGDDTLTGGGGADKFVFASIGDIDTITDFQHGIDRIVFPGSVAGLPVGTLSEGMFRNGSVAQDSDDRILYDQNTGALSFDVDGVGGYDAFQVAVISNKAMLSASDFLVI